jgi:hypothetical protein
MNKMGFSNKGRCYRLPFLLVKKAGLPLQYKLDSRIEIALLNRNDAKKYYLKLPFTSSHNSEINKLLII